MSIASNKADWHGPRVAQRKLRRIKRGTAIRKGVPYGRKRGQK